jgi:menaquinone-dependent protoporphyrinogen oxidase
MTGKVLVAFASRTGAAEGYASTIAGVLRKHGHEVDIWDLGRMGRPDPAGYDAVVVGSGIRMGRWYGPAKRLLRHKAMAGRPVAIYVACMTVAKEGGHDKAMADYVDRVAAKLPRLDIVDRAAFGGHYEMRGTHVEDARDPAKAEAWAEGLAERLRG